MPYVDGFVLPVKKKDLPAYKRLARVASRAWLRHGALEYKECVGDDLKWTLGVPFPRAAKVKRGETVVFGYTVYRSRAHRDRVFAKVLEDPELAKAMEKGSQLFDVKRMMFGGFKVMVDAVAKRR